MHHLDKYYCRRGPGIDSHNEGLAASKVSQNSRSCSSRSVLPTTSHRHTFLVWCHAPATLNVAKSAVTLLQLPRVNVRGGVPKSGTTTPGTSSGTAKTYVLHGRNGRSSASQCALASRREAAAATERLGYGVHMRLPRDLSARIHLNTVRIRECHA